MAKLLSNETANRLFSMLGHHRTRVSQDERPIDIGGRRGGGGGGGFPKGDKWLFGFEFTDDPANTLYLHNCYYHLLGESKNFGSTTAGIEGRMTLGGITTDTETEWGCAIDTNWPVDGQANPYIQLVLVATKADMLVKPPQVAGEAPRFRVPIYWFKFHTLLVDYIHGNIARPEMPIATSVTPLQVGYNDKGPEAVNAALPNPEWKAIGQIGDATNTGCEVVVYSHMRNVYYDTGTKIWYAYARPWRISANGTIASIGREERIVIETPVTWSV